MGGGESVYFPSLLLLLLLLLSQRKASKEEAGAHASKTRVFAAQHQCRVRAVNPVSAATFEKSGRRARESINTQLKKK